MSTDEIKLRILGAMRTGDMSTSKALFDELCPGSDSDRLSHFFSSLCSKTAQSVDCNGHLFAERTATSECMALPGSAFVGPDGSVR